MMNSGLKIGDWGLKIAKSEYKIGYLGWLRGLLLTILSLFIFTLPIFAQSDINISGDNSLTYIYRTVKDSLNSYFQNETSVRVDFKNFTFGMTFLAELPKYDKFEAKEELHPGDLNTEWVDRFVQLRYDDLLVRVGTVEEAYGAGLVLRSFRDTDLNRDKRLEGARVNYTFENLKLSGIYGALREDIGVQGIRKNDLVIGVDADLKPLDFLILGASAVQLKQYEMKESRKYTHTDIYGGRMNLMFDMFDVSTEYAHMIQSYNALDSRPGSAFYITTNMYMGIFTLTGSYKNYLRYNNPLADLPTLNHYDELLSSYADLVNDTEEGVQGKLVFIPDFDNEFLLDYAESWNKNFTVRHSNFFGEYKRNFSSLTASFEYEHLEKIDKNLQTWEQELRPAVNIDLYSMAKPTIVKFLWSITSDESFDSSVFDTIKKSHHKPYLQVDTKFHERLAVSISAEYEFKDMDDLVKNRVYLGGEIVTSISQHTDVSLFLGKEKGGKVCRNGVCQFQAPFEGIKFSLNTRF